MAVSLRGCDELLPEADWLAKLARSEATGVPLRIKLGLDPTAPDIHLGHTVVLNKMRQLQDLGHTVIFLIGDFTSMIGDPSGRNTTRPPLTREQIEANAQTYYRQASLVLDPARTEIRYNSEWSDPLGARGMIQLASRYTVARMMERNDFAERFKAGTPISRARVPLPADAGLRLGGAEVRPRARRHRPEVQPAGRPRAAGRVRPGAAVHPDDAAARGPGRRREDVQEQGQLHRHHRTGEHDVRQAAEHQRHADVALLHAAQLPLRSARSRRSQAEVAAGRNPKDAKVLLAREICTRFHSAAAADAAERDFELRARGGVPDEIPAVALAGAPLAIGVAAQAGRPGAVEQRGAAPGRRRAACASTARSSATGRCGWPPAPTSCRSASAASRASP